MIARMLNDFTPLVRLQDEMNRLFEGFFDDATHRPYGSSYPGINLWEDGDSAHLEAEVPGMSMDEVEVLVAGNQLTINGKRKISAPEKASYYRRERAAGEFSRTLDLPWEIDAAKVTAKLRDGVLTVSLPKCESCKPKKVKVLPA